MPARRISIALLLLTMGLTGILFNNCAGQFQGIDGDATSASQSSSEIIGNLNAHVDSVSTVGKIWGFAQDSANKTGIIKILIYANGPIGVGTYVGAASANVNAPGTYGGHYFSFQLPNELITGGSQQLYVYGGSAKPANLISPSPLTFASYAPKAEDFFNRNIAPTTTGECSRCHGWTYQGLFYGPLMNPSPFNGGTATTNRMIRKLGGLEGHGGGNFCPGGLDTGICAQVQAWWRAEFQ